MKKFLIFALCLAFASQTFAQNDSTLKRKNTFQTVLKRNKNGKTRLSGYFNVLNELSLPSNKTLGLAYSIGGEAVALYNQRFYLGGYSLVSVAPEDLENTYSDNQDLKMLQIGGTLGLKIAPNSPVHLNVGSRIGYASLQWYEWTNNMYDHARLAQKLDGWMVAPHLNVEVNFFSWLQAHAGIGYRFAWGGKGEKYDVERDLRQPTVQIGISFGYFK